MRKTIFSLLLRFRRSTEHIVVPNNLLPALRPLEAFCINNKKIGASDHAVLSMLAPIFFFLPIAVVLLDEVDCRLGDGVA